MDGYCWLYMAFTIVRNNKMRYQLSQWPNTSCLDWKLSNFLALIASRTIRHTYKLLIHPPFIPKLTGENGVANRPSPPTSYPRGAHMTRPFPSSPTSSSSQSGSLSTYLKSPSAILKYITSQTGHFDEIKCGRC